MGFVTMKYTRILQLSLFVAWGFTAAETAIFHACPETSALFQGKDDFWYAEGGWRSVDSSFSKSVQEFVGAQWKGVNPGKLVCVYSDGDKEHFPIVLMAPGLYKKPAGKNWSTHPIQPNEPNIYKASKQQQAVNHLVDGAYQCIADQTINCPLTPFEDRQAPIQTNQDVKNLFNSIKPFNPSTSSGDES
jgi:hypothetical protein